MSIIAQAASSTTGTLYTLIVNSGSGDGVYAAGSVVTITADAPSAGMLFDQWTGASVAIPTSGSTTITMTGNFTVTATYVSADPATYTLAVVNGTGDGNYVAGHVVAIMADAAAPGRVFDTWTGATVADPSMASTTLTMPASAATVSANYVDGPFYNLVVTSGSGSGSYLAGAVVTITADAPASGDVFDMWTGDTVADASASSTTITMPAADQAVTATYSTVPATFTLTVVSGTGGGNFAASSVNPIVANAPAAGHVFSAWTGGGGAVANPAASSTTVTMPASALSVTATYVPGPFFVLTVNSGTGDGSYLAGAVVTIVADAPATGKVFSAWTGGTVANASSPSTTVTMPTHAVTVTATYVDNPVTYTLIVTQGNGDGNYSAGAVVTITANAPATGKQFAAWTGGGGAVASTTSATTTVTMPSHALTVTATYSDIPSIGTFYTSTTGSDSNPGTFASPFRTVAKGISVLAPSYTLLVRGGTYAENITTSPSGTSWNNKVRIAAYSGETVWLTPTSPNPGGHIIWLDGNFHYIEFDGINLDGTQSGPDGDNIGQGGVWVSTNNLNDPHHIRFQNAEVIAGAIGGGAAIVLGSHQTLNQTGANEIINCTIHGGGRPGECGFGCASYGVYPQGPNNLIEYCDIYDTCGAGIHIYNASGDPPNNNIARNNTVHDITRTGSVNEVWGFLVSGSNNQIYNNLIYGINVGAVNPSNAGIAVGGGTSNTQIYDNTVYGNSNSGIYVDSNAATTIVRNNISYGNAGTNYVNGSGTTTHDHNIDDGTNPLFTNAGAHDFTVAGGSPALGAGVGIAFIDTDITGAPRPTSGACTIGAYEA